MLKPDKYKDVITGSLKYLAEKNRVKIFAFVIMSNHIHLMWQVQAGNNLPDVQRDFFKIYSPTDKVRFKHPPPACAGEIYSECERQDAPVLGTKPVEYRFVHKRCIPAKT